MKKVLFLSVIAILLSYGIFAALEADVVLATSSVSTTTVSLTVSDELSLACPVATANLGTIAGLTGGSATADVDCNVKTNNYNGYTLTLTPTTSPALMTADGHSSFANYIATSTPDYSWTVAAAEAKFGFSVTSTDVVAAFKNDGASACGAPGSVIGLDHCFVGFDGTNATQIASKSIQTTVSGVTTTVRYKAEVGNAKGQPSGSYSATITITAATL
ncbi:MAG: hypothetical protein WCT11_03125 [Candidatus Magasanikbacteria bacterium]